MTAPTFDFSDFLDVLKWLLPAAAVALAMWGLMQRGDGDYGDDDQ
jgi:hypothetical protein